jgi:hypothetical protein
MVKVNDKKLALNKLRIHKKLCGYLTINTDNSRTIVLLIALTIIFSFSCDKDQNDIQIEAVQVDNYKAPCKIVVSRNACGIEDIGNNLPWLKDIITKSLTDKTGQYIGKIWCKKYKDQDYIVCDMGLFSGGLAYHTFNCSGTFSPINDIRFYNSLSEREVIWKSHCWID